MSKEPKFPESKNDEQSLIFFALLNERKGHVDIINDCINRLLEGKTVESEITQINHRLKMIEEYTKLIIKYRK